MQQLQETSTTIRAGRGKGRDWVYQILEAWSEGLQKAETQAVKREVPPPAAGVPEGSPMNLARRVWMKKAWNPLLLLLAWSAVAEVTLTGRGSKEQFLSSSSSLAVSL